MFAGSEIFAFTQLSFFFEVLHLINLLYFRCAQLLYIENSDLKF